MRVIAIGLSFATSVSLPQVGLAAKDSSYCDYSAPVDQPYTVSAPFSQKHQAVDLAIELGSTVHSVADGTVVKINRPRKDEQERPARIVIKHSGGNRTIYSQLRRVDVKKGDKVQVGDSIGLSGGSGKGSFRSTGPHLHFAVKNSHGKNVNPICVVQ